MITKTRLPFILILSAFFIQTAAQPYPKTGFNHLSFNQRKQILLDSIASWAGTFNIEDFKNSDNFEGGKYGAYPIMALYETGQLEKAREFTAQQLIGGGAMFREFTTMALYMEYQHLYTPELRNRVKQDQLKSNFFITDIKKDAKAPGESHANPRLGGASENHKLMYAAAAYLAGLAWPDEYPKEWAQIGYDHLMNWFEIVTSIGFWEEDSPTYLIHHLGPLVSVADHAPEGSEMKKRATMVLDWYFASIAGEYLQGYWITPAARDYNPLYGLQMSAETTALTWLMFGDAQQIPNPHVYQPFRHWKAALHFVVSGYRVPEILVRIATDRKSAFIHKEFMKKNPMNPKEYCYLSQNYGMASIMGENGKIVPDMTRWKVQWIPSGPEKEPGIFFMKHPVEGNKWEKWRGASPAEQVLQHEDALIALYKMEDGMMPFIEGPFCRNSFEKVIWKDGWMFAHTGANLLAVKAVKGMQITGEKRLSDDHGPEMETDVLRSEGKKNAVIVQTSPLHPYNAPDSKACLDKFIKDVLAKTEIDTSGFATESPKIKYKSLSGDRLEIQFDIYKKVNEKEIDFENWPLLGNPWMHQEIGGSLTLGHKGEKRVYDFEKWEIKKY